MCVDGQNRWIMRNWGWKGLQEILICSDWCALNRGVIYGDVKQEVAFWGRKSCNDKHLFIFLNNNCVFRCKSCCYNQRKILFSRSSTLTSFVILLFQFGRADKWIPEGKCISTENKRLASPIIASALIRLHIKTGIVSFGISRLPSKHNFPSESGYNQVGVYNRENNHKVIFLHLFHPSSHK